MGRRTHSRRRHSKRHHSKRRHSKRRHSKRHHSTRRHSTRRHSTRRHRGGSAPVNYSLAGNWSSKASMGQGVDFFKYHQGQHGGVAPISTIGADSLPAGLRGSAHIGGLDKAFADVSGLSDNPTVGGRRKSYRRGRKSHRKSHRHGRKSHRRSHRNKKRRGGGLAGAPFPSPGMLLSSPTQYAQAGLNPTWKTDIAFGAARLRDTQ